jgi:hypothetical protein
MVNLRRSERFAHFTTGWSSSPKFENNVMPSFPTLCAQRPFGVAAAFAFDVGALLLLLSFGVALGAPTRSCELSELFVIQTANLSPKMEGPSH